MSEPVTLVIPARNAAPTLPDCLGAVVPLRERGELAEILLVDDGSTDETARIAAGYPVRVIPGDGRGPGAARNLGWRAATTELVWLVDADCVAEPDALELLRARLDDPGVVGVGGSYGNMRPESLLACLIHEEIRQRHLGMPGEVDFLATFNTLYRREVLESVGGFDERFLKAQDAELAYRIRRAGGRLRFEPRSLVRHFHPDRLGLYLRTQRQQGYWRIWLYREHAGKAGGDSYSDLWDHLQPPLALICLGSLLPAAAGAPLGLCLAPWLLLGVAPLPMTVRIIRRVRQWRYGWYAPLSSLRAFWRGVGALHGLMARLAAGRRSR